MPVLGVRLRWWAGLLLIGEALLCSAIVLRVAYTEIDWVAYMEEVAGVFQHGQLDYEQLRGGTGPLVYPAGFVYAYGALWALTGWGSDIRTAQWLFVVLSVATHAAVLWVYSAALGFSDRGIAQSRTGSTNSPRKITWMPLWAIMILFASRRIHSLFVLRLFNDCLAMFFAYVSIGFLARARYRWGCLFFSLAVSVKMNVLLMAPALLFLMLKELTLWQTFLNLVVCGSTQVVLGLPFLLTHPLSYLRKAFDFSRVFFYTWTVNWRMIPEEIFVSRPLALGLLCCHLAVLGIFVWKWHEQTSVGSQRDSQLTPRSRVYVLFVSNFVGVCFSRTLHYQFYVWYFHMLPLLLWHSTSIPVVGKVVVVVAVEWVFNTFPPTGLASTVLFVCHFMLLLALLRAEFVASPLSPRAKLA